MTATNTYSQSGIISTLRAKGISTTDITDDDLLIIIDDCLNQWLMYRPKICITSHATCITTVADTPSYDKPADALIIRQVCWNPSYLDTDYDDVWLKIMLEHINERDIDVMSFDYQQLSTLNRYFKGFWELRSDKIFLKPTPEGVYHVAVIYGTSRALDELDEIADYRFIDLCFWTAMYAVGVKKVTGGGWRAGQFQVSEAVGRETMKWAEKGLNETRLQIANAYTASRS